jgi:endonuclease/exonuclease/phosphatase (EEP) superfamily protein YafD
LNEARAHHEHLDGLLGWTTFVGEDPALTISWRDDLLRMVDSGAHWAYDDTYVGRWGAGPSTLRAAWDPVVTLESRQTGERVAVMAVHLAPSVTRRRPILAKPRASWERRREVYRDEVAMIARVAGSTAESPFVVVGDFNAPPTFELLDPLRDARLRTVRTDPTHGRRQIDLAWARGCDLSFMSTTRTPSDHRAISWRITL